MRAAAGVLVRALASRPRTPGGTSESAPFPSACVLLGLLNGNAKAREGELARRQLLRSGQAATGKQARAAPVLIPWSVAADQLRAVVLGKQQLLQALPHWDDELLASDRTAEHLDKKTFTEAVTRLRTGKQTTRYWALRWARGCRTPTWACPPV